MGSLRTGLGGSPARLLGISCPISSQLSRRTTRYLLSSFVMELRQLTSLLAIADHGSFSAAARALGTVQSNVSAHISRLEKDLGSILVDRHSGVLTESGEAVAERARRIVHELDDIQADVKARDDVVEGVRAQHGESDKEAAGSCEHQGTRVVDGRGRSRGDTGWVLLHTRPYVSRAGGCVAGCWWEGCCCCSCSSCCWRW